MDSYTGVHLRETLKNLGINTGNVSNLTIDSWFDSDSNDMKELLNWICSSLTSENVLTPSELNEYEEAVKNNELLSGKQYEAELNQLKLKYPGILEYEMNVFDSECMEDELMVLLEEEKHLEQVLEVNQNVGKILSRELSEKKDEEVALSIEKKASEEKCLELSFQLDDVNRKLQEQVSLYAETIREYDYTTKPVFLSSFPLIEYEQYYTDVNSYISLLLKKERNTCPKFNSTMKSARKRLLSENKSRTIGDVDNLEILRERIFQSTYKYFCKEIEKDTLLAQISFLENADWTSISQNESLEINNILKTELVDQMFGDLENVCLDLSNSIIEKPKLSFMMSTMDTKQQKLNCLTRISEIVIKILASIILLQLLINIERNDIQVTNNFFRDIHHYITNNLQNCELRTKSMTEIIQNYVVYTNLTVDQKLPLANILKAFLGDEFEDTSVLDIIKQFEKDCLQLEHQVFYEDVKAHQQYCQLLKQDIIILQKFLTNGPTCSIITFPQQIINTFNSVSSIIESQNVNLQTVLQTVSSAKNKLAKNKWLKMKRLLLMWFLYKPNKMLAAIQEIQEEVTNQRNQKSINSTTQM